MKILIVDDERISRKILVSKMKTLGNCVAVGDSKAALAEMKKAAAQNAPFDLITLDVSMPGMDGAQMLRHIRRREIKDKVARSDRAKILMVTARMNMNTIKACIKLGCNGYLTKPVSRIQLLQNLGKMGVDTKKALEAGQAEVSHTAAVADIINRFYSGKIALPVLPSIVQEVEALVAGASPSIEALGKIVEKDIVISSRLISIANSPLYKGMDTVESLSGALVRLGLKTTQTVVSAVAARNLFDSDNASLKAELERLWIHSFAVATLAKHLGDAAGIEKTENLFLMGIVHDIGKMLLMKAFVDIHPDTSIDDREIQLAIHEIHTTFGAVLVKKMRFPHPFVQVAEFHHWGRYEKDTDPELMVISLADHLAGELGFGFLTDKIPEGSGEGQAALVTEAAHRREMVSRIKALSATDHLGLTPEVILTMGEKVASMIKESAKAF